MAETARAEGVSIVAGDTKVIEGNGGLYINTSGIGIVPDGRILGASNLKEGDSVILSGSIGEHHACILSARMAIENGIESDCACLSDITRALFNSNINVKAMRDITRGGLGTILNELADSSKCAIEVTERNIPVNGEVRGLCDILGLDPLYMGNEGKLVVVVAAGDAEKAIAAMKRTENGKDASLIGTVKKGSGVAMETKIGGRRGIHVMHGEGLPRIC
jgi:hydrogenase expression/formation protein HypE